MLPKEWSPSGNRHPFPEPYLAHPSGSSLKVPFLQVSLIKLPQRKMPHFQSPHSFIFQNPWYVSPLPGSPVGPLRREMHVPRAPMIFSGDLLPNHSQVGTRRRWVISTTLWLLYPQKSPSNHCAGGWLGLRAGLMAVEISPPPGFISLQICCRIISQLF
jgi:hypothetical protein